MSGRTASDEKSYSSSKAQLPVYPCGVLPTVLILGFIAGTLSQRPRTLSVTILALGLFWACLVSDVFFGAFALGATNALVGVLAGALPWVIVDRLRPTH